MYLFFVDESGHDEQTSPYAVLAGVAVPDRRLGSLVHRLHEMELEFFGLRLSEVGVEIKGKKFLNHKVFRLAGQDEPYEALERTPLACACLAKGFQARGQENSGASRPELTAMAQAKIAFCDEAISEAVRHGAVAVAAVVAQGAPKPIGKDVLRRDYAFFFQRLYYFLEEQSERTQNDELGLVVFDEKDRSQCHVLVGQMERYFSQTRRGKERSSRLIPEPLFVHSDLTSLVQLADLVAYIISWGVRFSPKMVAPFRQELTNLAESVLKLRYQTQKTHDGMTNVWSFFFLDDLRPQEERKNKRQ